MALLQIVCSLVDNTRKYGSDIPLEPQRSSRSDRRTWRLRDAQAALDRLTTAAKLVSRGVRFAAIGSYYAAKLSVNAVRYVVATSISLTARRNRLRSRPRVRPRPITLRRYKFQINPRRGH